MVIHSGQGCEAWVVKNCPVFDFTLFVSARVRVWQVQLVHLLTGWDSPISASISWFLLPLDYLKQHGTMCVNCMPTIVRCQDWPYKGKRPLQLCEYVSITYIFIYRLCMYIYIYIYTHTHGLFSIKFPMAKLANMK